MNIKMTFAAAVLSIGLSPAMGGMDMSHTDHSSHSSTRSIDSVKNDDLVLTPTAAQLKKAKPAKNKICPVDHAAIGSMGKPVYVIWNGQVVALSCEPCKKGFAKDPAKFTAASLASKESQNK